MSELCPCKSGEAYADCCEPRHLGSQPADNAEQLMRSRYSAFALGLVNYLIMTLHPSKRQPGEAQSLRQTIENTHWLGLTIIDCKHSQSQSEVEFIAFYQDDPIGQLHERSRFTCEAGRWFYHDGLFLPPQKIAANSLCFCGSGKKFKRCHGQR